MDNLHSTAFIFINCNIEYCYMRECLEEAGIITENFSLVHDVGRGELDYIIDSLNKIDGTVVVIFRLETIIPDFKNIFSYNLKNFLIIPLGEEAVALQIHTIDGIDVENINRYVINGGKENIHRAAEYILKKILKLTATPEPLPPVERPFDGIFSPESGRTWSSLPEFLTGNSRKEFHVYVGWLIHRHNWNNEDYDDVRLAEKIFAENGIGLIPVFSNSGQNCLTFSEIIEKYFSLKGRLVIDALVNGQLFAIRAEDGLSVSEQTVLEYKRLNIPIITPIHSFYLTEHEWRTKDSSISLDVPTAYLTPESTGMIESTIVSTRTENCTRRTVMPEMIDYLCGRTAKWVTLRKKKNCEKKLVIMMHSSVCSGVEATIGKAYGLDVFESVCSLAVALKKEGYKIGDFPTNGIDLFNIFMKKKAFADFRWTAVEDIVESGGCIYEMDVTSEYMRYYELLPEKLRCDMEETWGVPPGEGMVLKNKLIITGVTFGNITVMIQPKRGCYGAKCTGEVCRILHDPCCPPPHQYFAVYRYIEQVLRADACIEMGTEGSLEFLPGKSNALSRECWPYVVLGKLPLIYVYNTGVPGEAVIAKRRINALTVGHLPLAYGSTLEASQLVCYIDEYFKAKEIGNGQEGDILDKVNTLLSKLPCLKNIVEQTIEIDEGLRLAADALKNRVSSWNCGRRHILGKVPDEVEIIKYIKEVLHSEEKLSPPNDKDGDSYNAAMYIEIKDGITGNGKLSSDVETLYSGLQQCSNEITSVINALNGYYIEPGEAGTPDSNGRAILPTGRNLHSLNTTKIPTRTAYEKGVQMAEDLIIAYIRDEGKVPHKIALNMISLDITKTGGEQLCQFLHLLGVRPYWDLKGKFCGLEAIPLNELGRPRIDVVVRISGVLRDTYPFAVKIMDDAILLVASLNESTEDNYVINHIKDYQKTYPSANVRDASVRVFGDAPGAYGAGIDLALMASAWQNETDLAKYFIHASAFGYGKELNGKSYIREFVDNMKNVELSSDTSVYKRMDSISSGFGIQVHGGIQLVAKLLGKNDIRHYQCVQENGKEIKVLSLKESIEKDISATLLNPLWRENRKKDGRDGISDIMSLIQNIFIAQCCCQLIDDHILDELADTYINDDEIREWMLLENNFAAEESARRLLELYSRKKWLPSPNVLSRLQKSYLMIEGEMEGTTNSIGEIQGGTVEPVNHQRVESWRKKLSDVEKIISEMTMQ